MKPASSNDLPSVLPQSHARRGFQLARLAGKHLGILLLVLILPPLWYDFFSGTPWSQHNLLLMAGAFIWPLYFVWLGLKCPWPRLRFILLQLIGLLSLMGLAMLTTDCRAPDWQTWLVLVGPPLAALLPLPAVRRAEREPPGLRRRWLVASLASLPFALGYAALTVYATGMCAMAGMRW